VLQLRADTMVSILIRDDECVLSTVCYQVWVLAVGSASGEEQGPSVAATL
jgi:hypothetical protein